MTDNFSRRTAVKALGMGAVAMAASETSQAQIPTPAKVPAFAGNHQPKPLKFDPVEGIPLGATLVLRIR